MYIFVKQKITAMWIRALFLMTALGLSLFTSSEKPTSVEVQGKAYYFSKSKLDLGNWAARMSEAQKNKCKPDSKIDWRKPIF